MSSNNVPAQKKKNEWYDWGYNINVQLTGYNTGGVFWWANSKNVSCKKQGNGDVKRHCDPVNTSEDNKNANGQKMTAPRHVLQS